MRGLLTRTRPLHIARTRGTAPTGDQIHGRLIKAPFGRGGGGAPGAPLWSRILIICFLLGCISALSAVLLLARFPNHEDDIYYIWQDGSDIAQGVNPYSRIHNSDMLENDKFSTYFPGFYLLVSAARLVGVETFEQWLWIWQPLNMLAHLAVGVLILLMLWRTTNVIIALFGAAFWLFNRWSLYVVMAGQIDVLAILLVVLSLLAIERSRVRAWLLFGVSLAIKQIGIFILPLYLLFHWRRGVGVFANVREALRCLMWIALVPSLLIAPFLLWDASGFLNSVFFSATRMPGGHFGAQSIDHALGGVGALAKLPMLGMMGLLYLAYYLGLLPRYAVVTLIFLCFVNFNSVFFKQYLAWGFAFLPLALSEAATLVRARRDNIAELRRPQTMSAGA